MIKFNTKLIIFICLIFQCIAALAMPEPERHKTIVLTGFKRGDRAPKWKFIAEKSGLYLVELYEGNVYLYDRVEDLLMQINPLTGKVNWKTKIAGKEKLPKSFIVTQMKKIEFSSLRGSKYILINDFNIINEMTGEVIKAQDPNGAFEIVGEALIEYKDCKKNVNDVECETISRLDPDKGKEIWKISGKVRPGISICMWTNLQALGTNYLLHSWQDLTLIDVTSGKKIWTRSPTPGFRWEFLNYSNCKNVPLLSDNVFLIKDTGVISGLTAIDLATGKDLWTSKLPKDKSTGGMIRPQNIINLQSGLVFYDGIAINIIPRHLNNKPLVIWPKDQQDGFLANVTFLEKVGVDSLIVKLEPFDKNKSGAKVLRLEASGQISWKYRGQKETRLTLIAVGTETIEIKHEQYDKTTANVHPIKQEQLRISLKDGKPVNEPDFTEVLKPLRRPLHPDYIVPSYSELGKVLLEETKFSADKSDSGEEFKIGRFMEIGEGYYVGIQTLERGY